VSASALKVYACVDWDASTETCTTHAYIDPPTILPTLSAADGYEIGMKLVWVYVSVRVVTLLREAITDRIGS
jgi:hypothetical protein